MTLEPHGGGMRKAVLLLGLLAAGVVVAFHLPANEITLVVEPDTPRMEELLNQSEDSGPPGYIFEQRSLWERIRDGWIVLWNPPTRITGGILR